MYKVLIIEDDFSICKEINTYLSKWSYVCKIIKDFNNTLDEFVEFNPHLVLLDINLPFFDGFYWCQKIRDLSNIPIIFISSHDTDMDKIMGISLGGDDFITKPFSLNLLTAKIQAILRRTYSYIDSSLNILQSGDVILNIDESVVLYNNKRQELTKNEYKILYLLMKNTGKIIKRDTIIEFLWEDESFVDDNTLTVNINRLRKKLNSLGLNNVIVTIKSMGYKFHES
ncbi:MAG: response regulator transcription factor [Eubacteriaceae bacterium]